MYYWICDYTVVREILDYDGGSHQLRRWCQELMGYHFTVIHHCARMMRDVDALTRRFGKAIALYCMQTHLIRSRNKLSRPLAYGFDHFHTTAKPQQVLPIPLLPTPNKQLVILPLLLLCLLHLHLPIRHLPLSQLYTTQ